MSNNLLMCSHFYAFMYLQLSLFWDTNIGSEVVKPVSIGI